MTGRIKDGYIGFSHSEYPSSHNETTLCAYLLVYTVGDTWPLWVWSTYPGLRRLTSQIPGPGLVGRYIWSLYLGVGVSGYLDISQKVYTNRYDCIMASMYRMFDDIHVRFVLFYLVSFRSPDVADTNKIHILQDCFDGIGITATLPHWQGGNFEDYGKWIGTLTI